MRKQEKARAEAVRAELAYAERLKSIAVARVKAVEHANARAVTEAALKAELANVKNSFGAGHQAAEAIRRSEEEGAAERKAMKTAAAELERRRSAQAAEALGAEIRAAAEAEEKRVKRLKYVKEVEKTRAEALVARGAVLDAYERVKGLQAELDALAATPVGQGAVIGRDGVGNNAVEVVALNGASTRRKRSKKPVVMRHRHPGSQYPAVPCPPGSHPMKSALDLAQEAQVSREGKERDQEARQRSAAEKAEARGRRALETAAAERDLIAVEEVAREIAQGRAAAAVAAVDEAARARMRAGGGKDAPQKVLEIAWESAFGHVGDVPERPRWKERVGAHGVRGEVVRSTRNDLGVPHWMHSAPSVLPDVDADRTDLEQLDLSHRSRDGAFEPNEHDVEVGDGDLSELSGGALSMCSSAADSGGWDADLASIAADLVKVEAAAKGLR